MQAPWPVTPDSAIGIVANPMSGRDIRRLVARASVFPNAEKTNMVLRLIASAGALGVERIFMSTDAMGVAAGVLRAARTRRARDGRWPELKFVELPDLTGTAADTRESVRAMRRAGVDVLAVLGGDGTVRAASQASGDTPLLPLSTGTNNAFPEMWESTVAGSAAALVATGMIDTEGATYRAKALTVEIAGTHETALVDVCISSAAHIGSRALWQVDQLRELYCAFAEPHAVGLSSIAGLLDPVARTEARGVRVVLATDPEPPRHVLAPIAPGVVATVGIGKIGPLTIGEPVVSSVPRGTVAVDGEREIEFGPSHPVTVTLTDSGPTVLDVRAILAEAASGKVLEHTPCYQEVR